MGIIPVMGGSGIAVLNAGRGCGLRGPQCRPDRPGDHRRRLRQAEIHLIRPLHLLIFVRRTRLGRLPGEAADATPDMISASCCRGRAGLVTVRPLHLPGALGLSSPGSRSDGRQSRPGHRRPGLRTASGPMFRRPSQATPHLRVRRRGPPPPGRPRRLRSLVARVDADPGVARPFDRRWRLLRPGRFELDRPDPARGLTPGKGSGTPPRPAPGTPPRRRRATGRASSSPPRFPRRNSGRTMASRATTRLLGGVYPSQARADGGDTSIRHATIVETRIGGLLRGRELDRKSDVL